MATTNMDYEAASGDRYEGSSVFFFSFFSFFFCGLKSSRKEPLHHSQFILFARVLWFLHHLPIVAQLYISGHFLSNFLITDEAPRYERDNRSASPRPARDDNDGARRRSASPAGNGDRWVAIGYFTTW